MAAGREQGWPLHQLSREAEGGWRRQEVEGRDGGVRVRYTITSLHCHWLCVEPSLHMQINSSSHNYAVIRSKLPSCCLLSASLINLVIR